MLVRLITAILKQWGAGGRVGCVPLSPHTVMGAPGAVPPLPGTAQLPAVRLALWHEAAAFVIKAGGHVPLFLG